MRNIVSICENEIQQNHLWRSSSVSTLTVEYHYLKFMHHKSNPKSYFSFHSNAYEVIALNLCTVHDNTAVMPYAKISSNIIAKNGITIKQIKQIIWNKIPRWNSTLLFFNASDCLTKQHSNVALQLTASQEMAMASWDWGHLYHSLQQLRQESQQKYSVSLSNGHFSSWKMAPHIKLNTAKNKSIQLKDIQELKNLEKQHQTIMICSIYIKGFSSTVYCYNHTYTQTLL